MKSLSENIFTVKRSNRLLAAILAVLACLSVSPVSSQVSYTTDTTYYVTVTYSEGSASVVVSEDIKDYITAVIDGGHVTLTSTASATINEITYGLYGTSTNGSFTFNGSYKATVELFGVTLTNPAGPAINILNGKRIEISAKKETVSTLTDGTSTESDAWKGALYCKGHIEFKGKGTLNVYGNYAHAIKAGEYIEMKNCTINVYSAVKDAINCNQYFLMESGEINLSGFGDDGIQVDMEDNDTSAENTGNFTMTGGTININMTGAAGESIKAEGVQSVASEASLNLSTGIEDVKSARMLGNKVLLDGKVLIKKNNQLFTLTGHEI
ncbi:MAG: carbohydrate-binding domain-containing protein [Paludibacteraceae bacterium]|nr:carbohydrate-binding domain-containing protein [Paludibacteraceae bacterium]